MSIDCRSVTVSLYCTTVIVNYNYYNNNNFMRNLSPKELQHNIQHDIIIMNKNY